MQNVSGGMSAAASRRSPCDDCDVRDLAICGALRVDEVQKLSRIMATIDLSAGDPIVDEGESADFV